ncbi:MAG TPA: NDP-sugar synthase [Solirubrobacteraceae bacterium]|jgi:mannose-1-phosphate guanylyltransferase|nr:NDP-sugar synthase [Solirubrobacteraceae bacterium]
MQALILAGGEGTRLQPLTSRVPKPVVKLVDQPFIGYMLDWLRGHGVDDVIMSCGFLADGVKSVLGDGSSFGISLTYVEEPHPLGTGGALKYAESLLQKRFFMLNGDVLTDIDLTKQLEQHERTGARTTLALIGVDDPSAYGLVRTRADCSVTEFLEKPGADEALDTNLVNAGAYILEREILLDMAPVGTNISIERDVFPKLVDHGLYGYEANGYWLDIGTPSRYLQATYDILEGKVNTKVGARLNASGMRLLPEGGVAGRIAAPVVISDGCGIAPTASIGGRVVLGHRVQIGPAVTVEDSVLLDGVTVGARTHIRGAIIGPDVVIGERCTIDGHVMLGEGVRIGDDNVLTAGARVFPGVELPSGAIRF